VYTGFLHDTVMLSFPAFVIAETASPALSSSGCGDSGFGAGSLRGVTLTSAEGVDSIMFPQFFAINVYSFPFSSPSRVTVSSAFNTDAISISSPFSMLYIFIFFFWLFPFQLIVACPFPLSAAILPVPPAAALRASVLYEASIFTSPPSSTRLRLSIHTVPLGAKRIHISPRTIVASGPKCCEKCFHSPLVLFPNGRFQL